MLPKPGQGLRQRIKMGIMYDLGYPVVKVEAVEAWLDEAIDRAVMMFSKYTPQSEEWTTFNAIPNVNRYIVPDDYLCIRSVVYHPRLMQRFFSNLFPYWDVWWGWIQNQSLTDYAIADMYHGQSLRVFGLQGTWTFNHPYLYLYPMPQDTVPVFVKYQRYLDLKDNDIREEDWVRDYATAIIKIRVGRVRSKYSSVPGPRGDISFDGSALIQEGNETIIRLIDELRKEHEEPMPIITG